MQSVQMSEIEKPVTQSKLGGVMIIAGSAVGAGMFSLPTVSAGMWFGWSIACMLLSWYVLYQVTVMILEVNLNFNPGDSFDTMVNGTLGKTWATINGLLLAFLLYILDYAYISGGGSIVNQTLSSTIGYEPPQVLSGLVFAFVLAFVVWLSTKAVDRVLTVLIGGMIITFFMATANLTLAADFSNLFGEQASTGAIGDIPAYMFVFAALPYYLTSFGFHCNVPSLVKYYGKQPKLIVRSMLIGSTMCFVIYFLWLLSTMGNLDQNAFEDIIAKGGNIGALVEGINQVINATALERVLGIFANMAIVSSFLGVSLALFDFIADKFSFDDSPLGRLKTAVISFAPSTIGGVFFPDGFIAAIGFAGLVVAINALIIPPLMLMKSRQKFPDSEFVLVKGNGKLYFIMGAGVLYSACHIFYMLGMLPKLGYS